MRELPSFLFQRFCTRNDGFHFFERGFAYRTLDACLANDCPLLGVFEKRDQRARDHFEPKRYTRQLCIALSSSRLFHIVAERRKLSDPARETRGLQPERD